MKLRNLGIYRIAPEPQQPNGGLTGSTSRLVVSLYCERMELDLAAVP